MSLTASERGTQGEPWTCLLSRVGHVVRAPQMDYAASREPQALGTSGQLAYLPHGQWRGEAFARRLPPKTRRLTRLGPRTQEIFAPAG